MSRGGLLALLLLAACSRGPDTAEPSPEQACARQADEDPAVAEQLRKGAGNLDYQWQSGDRLRAAKEQAKLRCLRARGVAPKGGVELPRGR